MTLLQTPLKAIALKVVLKKQLTICFLYLEPGSNPTYNNLDNFIDQLEAPFIILGDLNSHSSMLHCNSTNAKGRIIEKLLEDHNISLLNDDSPTHYTSHTNTTSVIDWGLCYSIFFQIFNGMSLKSSTEVIISHYHEQKNA